MFLRSDASTKILKGIYVLTKSTRPWSRVSPRTREMHFEKKSQIAIGPPDNRGVVDPFTIAHDAQAKGQDAFSNIDNTHGTRALFGQTKVVVARMGDRRLFLYSSEETMLFLVEMKWGLVREVSRLNTFSSSSLPAN